MTPMKIVAITPLTDFNDFRPGCKSNPNDSPKPSMKLSLLNARAEQEREEVFAAYYIFLLCFLND